MNIRKIMRVGGAQAIAALAFGTETIEKVNKITGPGNEFVAEAKGKFLEGSDRLCSRTFRSFINCR